MLKVLVVDDHLEIRQLIRVLLHKTCEVIEADNGADALDIVIRETPDVVILDVMMPGDMDGLQVLSRIKGDPQLKDTQVIMVTARGQAPDLEQAMAMGADAYFIKPFSPLSLVNQIRERGQS